ncbi:MAG: tannase/feruloyl esterase family alpha/beta hydrolase [Myxococcales bacterium]|nr:tannase/feruloyl esterase family alpha/beta hydrolase [Myxococcales bacterium]
MRHISNLIFFAGLTICLWAVQAQATPARCRPATGVIMDQSCQILEDFQFPNTQIVSVSDEDDRSILLAGKGLGAHCVVQGKMFERTSPVDGQTYAIGFEMRLPRVWNGRFFYQGNGGLDGRVAPAFGSVSGGGPITHALEKGFAVISSDAGHNQAQNATFGLDPQARLDYGYQAVQKLTPMAKALIKAGYGKYPDVSYIGGTSNGGRHAMVAAARIPKEYDGYLAGSPGFHLPRTAIAQAYGAQQYAKVATDPSDLQTAFTQEERMTVANAILDQCDELDGIADGLIFDSEGCQQRFDLERDVPSCSSIRDGSCLTEEQKEAIAAVFAGAKNSEGIQLYAPFAYDSGIVGADWARWEMSASVQRDPVALGFVFTTPPLTSIEMNTSPELQRQYTLSFSMDEDAPTVDQTFGIYTESALDFMLPPKETKLRKLQRRGAKMIVILGASDGAYSTIDTENWYNRVLAKHRNARGFVRYFRVPGMNHSRNGPTTDQFDALAALINWVELGKAPDRIIATARGPGNLGGVNRELPEDWAPDRTRPLCAYPTIAIYNGSGDPEKAESFICRRNIRRNRRRLPSFR